MTLYHSGLVIPGASNGKDLLRTINKKVGLVGAYACKISPDFGVNLVILSPRDRSSSFYYRVYTDRRKKL